MRSALLTLALLLSLSVTASLDAAGLVVVAHPAFPVGNIGREELSRIFLGKLTRMGGTPVNPVNKESGSADRATFDTRVHGMDDSAMKEFWLAARIKGEGSPPRSFQSDAAVLRYVSGIPGAIGYVAFPPAAGARSLTIEGVAPTEQRYLLRSDR